MPNLKTLAKLARAPFLVLSVTLVVCGAGAAAFEATFRWLPSILALVGLVALHAAVNSLNEWSDMRTGIDLHTRRTPFSGGSGTLPAGHAPLAHALWLGLASAAVGLLVGVWFLLQVGWPLIPFMLVGAVLVLGYTAVLARVGLGEIAAGLGLGALPVAGTALVQQGTLGPVALAASVPAFLMTFNLLLLNEFPDEAADRAGGRRNLVLILGRKRAAWIYAAAALLVPAWIAATVAAGLLPALALLAALPSIALVKPLAWAFGDTANEVPHPALGANVVWNLATNTVLGAMLFDAAAMS